MNLNKDQLKELQAILIAVILTILIAFALSGCSTLAPFSTVVNASREYCASVTRNIAAYQECMKRETKLLDLLKGK
jgi:hypothetical protein